MQLPAGDRQADVQHVLRASFEEEGGKVGRVLLKSTSVLFIHPFSKVILAVCLCSCSIQRIRDVFSSRTVRCSLW